MRNQLWSGAVFAAVAGSISSALTPSHSVLSSLANDPITSAAGGERVGAELVTIDVTGIPSMDGGGSPNNVVLFIWVGPFNYVTGSGWDVVLQTLVPGSRRRDIVVAVRNTLNDPFSGFGIEPGAADPSPGGPTAYGSDGIVKLANQGIPPVQALADGLIRLEFGEGRDDAPGVADAIWVSGSNSLQTAFEIPPIVTPGAFGVFAVTGCVCLGRRQRVHDR
ncbi:MAG: hypothetical protein JNK58_12535 [Phycisphaerae bacterium]|nr:hypothetical protein [Phycisphaerae bacterium]